MKLIPLSQNKVAIVDDSDYEFLSQWKWSVDTSGNTWKAFRTEYHPIFRAKKILMHRLIVNAPDGMDVDHINGNGLDNRRENLRVCTHAENMSNKKISRNNTSGYKGVSKAPNGKYKAKIKCRGVEMYLGYFDTDIEAAQAYDKTAREHFGPYAKTNFGN